MSERTYIDPYWIKNKIFDMPYQREKFSSTNTDLGLGHSSHKNERYFYFKNLKVKLEEQSFSRTFQAGCFVISNYNSLI